MALTPDINTFLKAVNPTPEAMHLKIEAFPSEPTPGGRFRRGQGDKRDLFLRTVLFHSAGDKNDHFHVGCSSTAWQRLRGGSLDSGRVGSIQLSIDGSSGCPAVGSWFRPGRQLSGQRPPWDRTRCQLGFPPREIIVKLKNTDLTVAQTDFLTSLQLRVHREAPERILLLRSEQIEAVSPLQMAELVPT